MYCDTVTLKFTKLVTIIVILTMALTGAAMAQSVVINGVPLVTSRTPVTMAGSMLLPMRDVFEALHSEIKWFPAERRIMATRGDTTIDLWLGRQTATVNGNQVNLPVAPTLINGSTYVPLRFPAEAFGGSVKWDAATRTAQIDIPPVAGQTPAPAPATPPAPPPPPQPATPPAAAAPAVVEGTIVQVYETPHPAVMIQAGDTGQLRLVQLSAAVQITRNLQDGAPAQAGLADLKPGDAVQITLSPAGNAIRVAAIYAEQEGTVATLAGNTLVFQDGTALTVGNNARVLNAQGQPLSLSEIARGARAHVRYNPRTRTVWSIRLAQGIAPPPAQRQQVEIFTVGLTTPRVAFKNGDQVTLQLRGTPGGRATVRLKPLAVTAVLPEVTPGVYQTVYPVRHHGNLTGITLVGNLKVDGREAQPVISPVRLIIDNTPPIFSHLRPPPNVVLDNNSPTISLAYSDLGGSGINPATVSLLVDGQEVANAADVEQDFVAYTAHDLPNGQVHVEARVSDEAGNETVARWDFAIAQHRAPIITAAWQDAKGTLIAGDVVTVNMRVVHPGGVATYDLGDLHHGLPMTRDGNTLNYRGTYQVQPGDELTDGIVTVHYQDPQGRLASMEATNPLTINTRLPTRLSIIQPADGSIVGDTIVVRGTAPPYSRVQVTVTYRAKLIIWVTNQLWQGIMPVNGLGEWRTPEIGSDIGLLGKADQYTITARLLDRRGQVMDRQTVTVTK